MKNVTIVDINSSYSNIMASDMLCPIGEGVTGEKEGYNYKLYKILILNEVINEKGLPFATDTSGKFIISTGVKNNQYLKKLKPGMIIKLDSNEYERFKTYYSNKIQEDYTIETNWSFKAVKFNVIFGNFVKKYYKIKENASLTNNLGLKIWAKLLLNSLYGKFATKFFIKTGYVDYETSTTFTYEKENKTKFYLPIGIAITGGARMALVDACGFNYEKWIYNDTDSAFILSDVLARDFPNIILDDNKIGAWKIEGKNLIGIARRPKQYLYVSLEDFSLKTAFAGYKLENAFLFEQEEDRETEILAQGNINFTDMITGKLIDNQINKIVLPQGVQLYNYEKLLKPIWDFPRLYEQKYYKKTHFKNTQREIKVFEADFVNGSGDDIWNKVRNNVESKLLKEK